MYTDGVITLAPFEKEDLELVRAWVNDPDLARDVNRVLPVTTLEHEKWYADLVTRADAVTFVIRHESKTIGLCGLKTIDSRNRHAELWLYIGDSGKRGQGLGRRSFALLARFGFDQLNLNRIQIYVAECNTASLRACAACGFQEEGRLRDYIYIDGAYHDAISLAVLRHEHCDVATESMADVCGSA